jgi:GDP-4-dehydro-6-deoxy-D-mannose reductase
VAGATLVTGAAGFAGSHLLEQLAGSGELIGWGRHDPPPHLASLARWRRIDLLERDAVRHALAELRPSRVYHCAGAAHVSQSWQHTTEAFSSNVLTTHYLLDGLRRAGAPCRVVIPGSAMVYAPSQAAITEDDPIGPSSPYGLSKLAQEQLGIRAVREDGIDVVVARAFNHTGPRQSPEFAAPGMARQVALVESGALEAVNVGNLDAQRDLTDVRDTVRAYRLLMNVGRPGAVYNVATGVARPIRAVLDGLRARARRPIPVHIDPARLRPREVVTVLIGDASRLRAETEWAPSVSFDVMLDDLLAYWRAEVQRH